MRLYDSELKVMEVLWEHGPMTAAQIAGMLKDRADWSRNTTYTVIKKCVEKGAIRREEPKFRCVPLVTEREVQKEETRSLIGRMFHGSRLRFLAAYIEDEDLSEDELKELRDLIDRKEK